MYDIIIIGGGIAGLYAFYKIKSIAPNKKIILVERGSKDQLGGRMRTQQYYGERIMMGAGIGRKRKDKLLQKLAKELDVPMREFKSKHYLSKELEDTNCNVSDTFKELKRRYNENPPNKPTTFKEYAEKTLGSQKYEEFISCAGFSDYEKEGIEDTINNYGFNDNYESWTGLAINWDILKDKLVEKIGNSNIHYNKSIVKIDRNNNNNDEFSLTTATNQIYRSNQIVIATTIESIRQLLPEYNIYKEIHGQPFLRIYGKFTDQTAPIMAENVKGYTIVTGSLQKIIPIQKEKGIYMIAYSDNERAKRLKKYIEDTPENRGVLSRKVETAMGMVKGSLQLESIKSFYWEIGTHYYGPLKSKYGSSRDEFIKRAQNPEKGIYVIGEVLSKNQGWVEGALNSVETVIGGIIGM